MLISEHVLDKKSTVKENLIVCDKTPFSRPRIKKKHVSSYSVRSFQFKMLKFFSVKQKNMIGIVGLCVKTRLTELSVNPPKVRSISSLPFLNCKVYI